MKIIKNDSNCFIKTLTNGKLKYSSKKIFY